MKVAVLADVHGNLRALEAVLEHIRPLAVDAIINLGDCVSGPLWPGETCELLQSLGAVTVRGNHDRAAGQGVGMGESDRFAHERITSTQREWLAGLPFEFAFEEFWCFHANPRDDIEYLVDAVADGRVCLASENLVRARLGEAKRKVVLCGHSHQPRVVRLPRGVVIINPGSVGCPAYLDPGPPRHVCETGAPHARYALVTTGHGGLRTEFIALEYDWEDAAAVALRHGRPAWAHALRTGYAVADR